jgi:hypothetical protein
MNRATCICAALVATSAYANNASSNGGQEIVIADEVRTAFYEPAPLVLATPMSRAVDTWCSAADRRRIAESGKANAETVGWLCGSRKLRYFRNVYVTGTKGNHGLVCEDNGTSSLRYFGVDLVASIIRDGSCVPAELDGAAYQLHFESVNSDHTTATAKSVEGIRSLIGILAPCPNEQSISVEGVPADFDPKSVPTIPSTLGPPPIEPIRYEYWTVAGCGRHVKVLIQLWYDKGGVERFSAIGPKGWPDGS